LSNGHNDDTALEAQKDENQWQAFFERVDALRSELSAAGFKGVDSAELIRHAREERAARVSGEGR
jgi:hypothetical protein